MIADDYTHNRSGDKDSLHLPPQGQHFKAGNSVDNNVGGIENVTKREAPSVCLLHLKSAKRPSLEKVRDAG